MSSSERSELDEGSFAVSEALFFCEAEYFSDVV